MVLKICSIIFQAGRLSRVVSKLCRLVREGGVVSGPELLSLQAELHRAKESLAEAGRMLEQRAAQLRRNTQETMQLQSKLGKIFIFVMIIIKRRVKKVRN